MADQVISWAIQSHPDRAEMAAALAAMIGGQVEIVQDPNPSGVRSPWRTFDHLLRTTPQEATHRMQIQDDTEPCPYLREAVQAAVAARPTRLLLFYVGGNPRYHSMKVLAACQRNEPWAELDCHQAQTHWCPAVATCWPVEMAAEMVEWVKRRNWPERFGADDEIIGRWLREAGVRPLASVPSLVEHPDHVPTVNTPRHNDKARGGHNLARVAACYIGSCEECDDARLINWT